MRPFAKLLWTIAILNKNSNLRGELAVASSVMLRMFVKMVQVHNDGLFLERTRPNFCFFLRVYAEISHESQLSICGLIQPSGCVTFLKTISYVCRNYVRLYKTKLIRYRYASRQWRRQDFVTGGGGGMGL